MQPAAGRTARVVSLLKSAARKGRRRTGFTVEQFASWLISNHAWFWRSLRATPIVNSIVNRIFINFITTRAPWRPNPLSLWGPDSNPQGACAEYPSWTSLVDRTYTGRHLPPMPTGQAPSLPAVGDLRPLFDRGRAMAPCPKSTALFCFFAQWFTDSFLRTDATDVRKNTSNHEIDLCQIYGLNARDTAILRRRDDSGKLRTQLLKTRDRNNQEVADEEFPCWLFSPDGTQVRSEFRNLSYINDEGTGYRNPNVLPGDFNTPTRKAGLFAAGLERGNSTIFYSAINTIFIREHNRLCDLLVKRNPDWDGDRLFETARNINIAQLLKVIVEDYINHISPAKFRVFFELGWAERKPWYRTNRIAAEFNLLYRWHALVPTTIKVKGDVLPDTEFRFNDRYLADQVGLDAVFDAASTQSAGRISLENTAGFLLEAELRALEKGRAWRLQTYNDYRDRFSLPRLASFMELADDPLLAARLESVYRSVDNVDLVVGLLAEQSHSEDAVLGNLMAYMVGVDAFSQALTNPLLGERVFGAGAFSDLGTGIVNATHSFSQIVERNLRMEKCPEVTFTIATRPVPREPRLPLFLGKVQDFYHLIKMFFAWQRYFVERQAQFGSTVYGVNLYQPTVVLLDHVAIATLFVSRDFVQDYGFSWARPPRPLVGVTPSIFEAGAAHDRPKALYLRLLAKRRATFDATLQRVTAEFIERWIALPKPFSMRDELERFAASFLTEWLLGERFEADKLRLLYSNIFNHVLPEITDVFRGGIYAKSVKIHREWVAFIKASGEFEATLMPLAAAEGLTDRDAVAEQIAFLVGMNSFLGTQNLLKSLVAELALHPQWSGAIRADTPTSGAMPKIDQVLLETLRLHPPVTFIFGRAMCSRPLESKSGTFQVNRGDLLMGVLPFAQRDPELFTNPDDFRPERFTAPELARFPIWSRAYQDQRPTEANRTCAGKDEAMLIARSFALALLTQAEWRFASDPQWDRENFSLNVAAPMGDMAVKCFARSAASGGRFARDAGAMARGDRDCA